MEAPKVFSIKNSTISNLFYTGLLVVLYLISYTAHAQVMQLEVLGGAVVVQGSTITINAGSSLDFRITNIETNNCKNLRIRDVNISNTADFDINPNKRKRNIKPAGCSGPNWKKRLDFEIVNISPACATVSTLVTVEIKNQSDFTFTLEVNSSPEIYVLGGNPWAEIYHNSTITSDANGTFFGVDKTKLRSEFAAYADKGPAAFDNRLYAAAYAHSLDLISRDAQDHTGQFTRIESAGFHYT